MKLCFSLFFLAVVVPTSASAQAAQSWADPTTWAHVPEPSISKDIVYTAPTSAGYDPHSQRLDVFQNAAGSAKAPVLVYIHGGAWNHGDKPASWHGFRPWLAAGFSVVNVEYRLVTAAPAPAGVSDVRCALSWIQQNAAKYNFDTSRVVTYGTSAGGHLALLAAVLPAAGEPTGFYKDPPECAVQPHIAAVLDFYGPYHLEPTEPGAFTSSSTKRWFLGDKPGTAAAGADGKPTKPQPLLELSSAELLAREHALSPSSYIRKGIPPVFIAHGDADPTVPYGSSVALQKDLESAGVRNAFDTVPKGGHGGWPVDEQQRVALDSLRFLAAAGVLGPAAR